MTVAVPEPLEGRIERLRGELPGVVGQVTQVLVDNPKAFLLIGAGTVVATRAAVNIVRPRTAMEALALFVLLQMGLPMLASQAMQRGWLQLRVRDDEGHLVPLEPRKPDLVFHGEDCPGHTTGMPGGSCNAGTV